MTVGVTGGAFSGCRRSRPSAPLLDRSGCIESVLVSSTPPDPGSDPAPERGGTRQTHAPLPLVAAVGLVLLEAVVLVVYGVVEIFAVSGGRVVMGVTTSAFFVIYGLGLAYCARSVRRLESWARAPLVLAQLLQLGLAWSFRGGGGTAVAVVLALVAFLVLVGIFHPASLRALDDEPAED